MHEINPVSSLDPTQAIRWRTGGELTEEEELTLEALPAYQALDVSPIGLEASPQAGRRVLSAQVNTARTLMHETSSDELMSLDLGAPRESGPRPAPLVTNLNADDFMTNQVGGKTPPRPARPQQPARPAAKTPPKAPDKPPRPDTDFTNHPNFQRMSPEEQAQVKALLGQVKNRDDFYKLLDKNRLGHKDRGATLLQHLHDIATKELARGVNRQEVLDGVIGHLADPERIRQGNRNTCAATSIQYMLARQNPNEYARLVSGLVDARRDSVELADGSPLRRNQSALAEDDSGRNQVDRLLQSGFMERSVASKDRTVPSDFVTRSGKRYWDLSEKERARVWYEEFTDEQRARFSGKAGTSGRYDNKDDKIRWDGGEQSGMDRSDSPDVLDAVLGGKRKLVKFGGTEADKAEFKRNFARQLVGMYVSISFTASTNSNRNMHAMVVESVSDTTVSLYNPQGLSDTGTGVGPPRKRVGTAGVTMTIDDFFQRLRSYTAE